MQRSILALSLAGAALSAGVLHAQTPANAPVAQPSSPAPAVVQAPNAATAATQATQIVYSPKLPTVEELNNAAASQGLTVERIVQTANQVVAFYRNASGQPVTVAYQSLPPAGTVTSPAPAPAVAPAVVNVAPPVVYETAPRVVYYESPYYYYPRVWYPPVAVGFGFGYHRYYGGHSHGHYHGGFRHR